MKWFLLLVIVAIVQYQGVTGFPPATLPDYAESLPEKDHSCKLVKPLKKEDLFIARLDGSPISSKDAHLLPLFVSVDYLVHYLENAKSIYCWALEDLKYLIAYLNDYVTKNKDAQNQSTFSNVASDNKMQVDATQKDSRLKMLPLFNNPSLINKPDGIRRVRFTPDMSLRISDYLHSKMDSTRHVFNDLVGTFKRTIDLLKNRILKNKDTENQSTPENVASGDKSKPENVASGDKSTPENVASGDKSTPENVASGDKLTPENVASSDKIGDLVVEQQSMPDKNDDKKEESKDHEEQLIPESSASSNEAEEKATGKFRMLVERYKKDDSAKLIQLPLYFHNN